MTDENLLPHEVRVIRLEGIMLANLPNDHRLFAADRPAFDPDIDGDAHAIAYGEILRV